MTDYTKLGATIGDLVTEKNAAYGSSFAKAGDFLRLLWPDGLQPCQYDDALLLVRIFDKLMRIASDCDAFGESPYRDIAGYGLLGAALHLDRKTGDKESPCGSASAVAEDEPKAQPASPPPSAPATTTTTGDAPRPRSSSGGCFPRRGSSSLSEALQDAFARTAMADAASAEGDLRSVQLLMRELFINGCVALRKRGCCAQCREFIQEEDLVLQVVLGTEDAKVHSCRQCYDPFIERCRELLRELPR